MTSNKISAVINTYNAEKYLAEVLSSLRAFDEIVICDMESTDSTCAIASKFGCKIITFPKGTNKICEPARDFAIHSASHKWVLVVDADEIVPKTLCEYLYNAIDDGTFNDAFAIPRINLFMGEQFKEKTDYQIRFFQKDKTTWPKTIHSHPLIDGKIIKIPAKEELSLKHLDDSTLSQRISKMNIYTDYDTQRRSYKRISVINLIFRPAWFFIKSYVFQGGIKHGKKGIIKAYMSSLYQIVLMSKILEWQLKNNVKR